MNIQNLQRTIELLNTMDADDFDMSMYREGAEDVQKCNSVGCIIGHATCLDSKENWEKYIDDDNYGMFNFYSWSVDFYDLNCNGFANKTWEYMFDALWSMQCIDDTTVDIDVLKKAKAILNSPAHAVYRIQRIIDGYEPGQLYDEIEIELAKAIDAVKTNQEIAE